MNSSSEHSLPTGPPLVPPQELVRPEMPPIDTFNVTSPPLIQQTLPGPNQLPPPVLPPNNLPPGPPQQPNQQIQDLQSRLEKAQRREARYERRMDRAGSTMERMDHKDALYSDLGYLALNGVEIDHRERTTTVLGWNMYNSFGDMVGYIPAESTGGAAPAPRAGITFTTHAIEDFAYRDSQGNRVAPNHPDARLNTRTGTADGQPARTRTFFERRMDKRIDKRADKSGRAGALAWRRSSIFGPANDSDRHSTLTERIARKLQSSVDTHRNQKTARQNRQDKAKISATRNVPARETQQKKNRIANRKDRKTHRAINQPVLRRWRNMRRNRAIGKIQGNHQKAERQRELIDDLNNQINNIQNTP